MEEEEEGIKNRNNLSDWLKGKNHVLFICIEQTCMSECGGVGLAYSIQHISYVNLFNPYENHKNHSINTLP